MTVYNPTNSAKSAKFFFSEMNLERTHFKNLTPTETMITRSLCTGLCSLYPTPYTLYPIPYSLVPPLQYFIIIYTIEHYLLLWPQRILDSDWLALKVNNLTTPYAWAQPNKGRGLHYPNEAVRNLLN